VDLLCGPCGLAVRAMWACRGGHRAVGAVGLRCRPCGLAVRAASLRVGYVQGGAPRCGRCGLVVQAVRACRAGHHTRVKCVRGGPPHCGLPCGPCGLAGRATTLWALWACAVGHEGRWCGREGLRGVAKAAGVQRQSEPEPFTGWAWPQCGLQRPPNVATAP